MFSCFSPQEPSTHKFYYPETKEKNQIALKQLKEKGNASFKSQNFKNAISEYSQALDMFCTSKKKVELDENYDSDLVILLASLLSNRSASYLHLEMYQDALQDAEQVVNLRPDWTKDPSDKHIQSKLFKSNFKKVDHEQGFYIHQLSPGRHLCQKSWFSPIQNMIFDYAKQMRNYIYIVEHVKSSECIVVDACWDIDGILAYIKEQKLKLVGAALTHYHIDHCGGIPPEPYDKYKVRVDGIAKLLQKVPNIFAYVHKLDIHGVIQANPELSQSRIYSVDDGFVFELPLKSPSGPQVPIKFIHTPGHTPGSQCLLINNSRLISGDTLFVGSCGRVDFPDSCPESMKHSLSKTLSQLPSSVVVFPGHDYGGEYTTISREKQFGLL